MKAKAMHCKKTQTLKIGLGTGLSALARTAWTSHCHISCILKPTKGKQGTHYTNLKKVD